MARTPYPEIVSSLEAAPELSPLLEAVKSASGDGEDERHRGTMVRIAACQSAVLESLFRRVEREPDRSAFEARLLEGVRALTRDGHAFCFAANLGVMAFLLRSGIAWARMVDSVGKYSGADLESARTWTLHLATASPDHASSISWVCGYPEVGLVSGMSEGRRGSALSPEIRDAIDETTYGSLNSRTAIAAAALRIVMAVDAMRWTGRDLCMAIDLLSDEARWDLVFAVVEAYGPQRLRETPIVGNLAARPPPWRKRMYEATEAWLRCLESVGAACSDLKLALDAEPFRVEGPARTLLGDAACHRVLLALLRLAAMAKDERFDRALEGLEALEALFGELGPGHACHQVSVERAGYHYSDDFEELIEEALRLVRNEARPGRVMVASGGELECVVDVGVRCLPCFAEWLKARNYLLHRVDRWTRMDGAEQVNLEVRSADTKRVAGRFDVTCIEGHWFLRVFRREHARHWDRLYVPEEDREPEDNPGRDFSVAVGPTRVECTRELGDLLEKYRGRYHGRIPQQAVSAYRYVATL